jgi:meiotic recombination protein SPO11
VDRYVDDIAFTFSVPRSKLNVIAAAKGLVAGAFRICRRDGSTMNANEDRDGMLLPPLRDILSLDLIAVKWILVIEKEATFRSIASSTFWDAISACGVIITGKGYPDIATRALLHLLSMATPQNGFASPPVFGLADCDPDGLAILSIYRNGSAALVHENDNLRVPQLQWLGLQIDHMMDENLLHSTQGLLSLTKRDRRRAVKMLERNAGIDSEAELHMSRALQTMLMLNTKAELQLLDSVPNGMTNLLESKLDYLRSVVYISYRERQAKVRLHYARLQDRTESHQINTLLDGEI